MQMLKVLIANPANTRCSLFCPSAASAPNIPIIAQTQRVVSAAIRKLYQVDFLLAELGAFERSKGKSPSACPQENALFS